jgi:hypothetical protein
MISQNSEVNSGQWVGEALAELVLQKVRKHCGYICSQQQQRDKQSNKQKQLIHNTLAVESVVSQPVFNVM